MRLCSVRPCSFASLRFQRNAFALTELVVILAMLTVLAALSFPMLSKASVTSRCAKCLSQMKMWSTACMLYVDDSEGYLPREGYHKYGTVCWNNWAEVQAGQAKDAWYNILPPYFSQKAASSYGHSSGHATFYHPSNYFQCPSARIPAKAKKASSQLALFSRAMNAQLINPPRSSLRFAEIMQPRKVPLFLENLLEQDETVTEAQAKQYLGQPAAYANRFAGRRHKVSGNIVFADGHAATLPGEFVVQTEGPQAGWAIEPAGDVSWYPDEE